MTRWRAILEGEDAVRARARVEVILRDVRRLLDAGAQRASLDDPWLPLLFAYAWAADRGSEELEAYTVDRLAVSNQRLEAPVSSAALWGGLAGLAWLNAHVERVFIEEDAEGGGGGEGDAVEAAEDADVDADAEDVEEAGPALDRALAQIVREGAPAHYDLVSGLVGIGVVGIERSATETGAALIDTVCEELARRAAPEPATGAGAPLPGAPARTLFTPPEHLPPWQRAIAPAGYLNLGLAHGVPGAIGFLAHAVAAGRTAGGARALLSDLVAWTLAQRDRRSGGGGFTSWLVPGPRPAEPQGTRTAWCYGGLGAGAALVLAGTLAGDPAWRAEGTDICLAEAAGRARGVRHRRRRPLPRRRRQRAHLQPALPGHRPGALPRGGAALLPARPRRRRRHPRHRRLRRAGAALRR